ncbi:hypothetical protein JCM10296v2_003749 [Rhodotorula toruloides]
MGWHVRARRRHDSSEGNTTGSSSSQDSDDESTASSHDHYRHEKNDKRDADDSAEEDTESEGDDSDEAHHHRHRRKKRIETIWLAVGGAVLLLALVVGIVFATKSSSASFSAGSSSPTGGSIVDGSGGSDGGDSPTTGLATDSTDSPASSDSPSSGSASASAPASPGSPASSAGSSQGSSKSSPATPAASQPAGGGGPYKLVTTYAGTAFFDGWTFWDTAGSSCIQRMHVQFALSGTMRSLVDVGSQGQVTYLGSSTAADNKLISTSAKSAIMRVDNTTKLGSGAPRNSIRIHSKDAVKINSLIVADILHMPTGCATWPAWWSNGPNWPAGGEIDIVEQVHEATVNQYTLHVNDSGCKRASSPDITGTAVAANDDCNAHNKGNTGCSYSETASNSYGAPFNKAGGGVFATLFSSDAISVWFWSHGGSDLPKNIASGAPDMSTWGKPSATWPKSSCDIGKYFQDQTLIFDTTLCGDWAGAVWPSECSAKAPTCADYVADPTHFNDAWWEVASIKVYSI